jgi:hypothetical protein
MVGLKGSVCECNVSTSEQQGPQSCTSLPSQQAMNDHIPDFTQSHKKKINSTAYIEFSIFQLTIKDSHQA